MISIGSFVQVHDYARRFKGVVCNIRGNGMVMEYYVITKRSGHGSWLNRRWVQFISDLTTEELLTHKSAMVRELGKTKMSVTVYD